MNLVRLYNSDRAYKRIKNKLDHYGLELIIRYEGSRDEDSDEVFVGYGLIIKDEPNILRNGDVASLELEDIISIILGESKYQCSIIASIVNNVVAINDYQRYMDDLLYEGVDDIETLIDIVEEYIEQVKE